MNRNPNLRIIKKIIYAITRGLFVKKINDRYKNFKLIKNIEKEFNKHFDNESSLASKIIHIDHHLSHAAGSVLSSGFKNSSYITIDGFGDFVSTTLGNYENKKFFQLKEVNFPHSLGIFYTMITQFLGFKNYGDEYKVMGLAAYGKPKYYDKIRQIVLHHKSELFKLNLKYFKHHRGIDTSWLEGSPKIESLYSEELIELLGNPRDEINEINQYYRDIAASTQKVYEEIFINILNYLYDITQNPYLCISGGCGLNSLANGKIKSHTNFKNIFIPHSPGDSGGSIGSSMYFLNQKNANLNLKSFQTPYLGPFYKNDSIKKEIDLYKNEFSNADFNIKEFDKLDIPKIIALELSKQKIIGIYHGKSEFGARALGNRSIIADPRKENIKEIINLKIKKRESFRPFAPAILYEKVNDWFDCDDENVQYMSKVYPVKKDKVNLVPAIVHEDGTGRLQTVKKEDNPFFYNLIQSFYKISNVPIILNTSFNENEPIVNTPKEAIECFLRTKLDLLLLENFLISR